MSDASTSAAARLLRRAARQPLDAEGARVLAAAAATAAAAGDDVPTPADAGLALVAASAVATASAEPDLDHLRELALAVPDDERPLALSVAEPFLARVGAQWCWELLDEVVGADRAVAWGLGLQVAAAAARQGVDDWQPDVPLGEPYARQLAADRLARGVAAGRVDADDRRLGALRSDPPGRLLMPAEAAALLAGVSAADAELALRLAEGLLRTQTPADLQQALRLTATAAVAVGLGDPVVDLARKDGFVAEQAAWLAAAAAAGAADAETVQDLADELAPRVLDELDPGRELVAGLALLEALGHNGSGDRCLELAVQWRAPAPLLAQQLFAARAARAEALGRPGLDALLALPEDEWAPAYDARYGWWLAACDGVDQRRTAVTDVLALAAAPPWPVEPGGLADVVGWRPPR